MLARLGVALVVFCARSFSAISASRVRTSAVTIFLGSGVWGGTVMPPFVGGPSATALFATAGNSVFALEATIPGQPY